MWEAKEQEGERMNEEEWEPDWDTYDKDFVDEISEDFDDEDEEMK